MQLGHCHAVNPTHHHCFDKETYVKLFTFICLIMFSWETQSFKMMVQNSGQRVIVTISLSLIPGEFYILHLWEDNLQGKWSFFYSLKPDISKSMHHA